jgi:hypothetical protein
MMDARTTTENIAIALAKEAQEDNDHWSVLYNIALHVGWYKRGVFLKLREIHRDIEMELTPTLEQARKAYEQELRDFIVGHLHNAKFREDLKGVFRIDPA